MLLLLNIGNTHTQCGLWDGQRINPLPRRATAGLSRADLPPGIAVAAACVVPEARQRLDDPNIYWLDPFHCGSAVDFTRTDCSTLGADRVANALALAALHPLPGIVVDCGTAITLEVVDRDRIFRGGAIAPGRGLMRRILASGTAQLPEVPFSATVPTEPGDGTAASIRFGIDCGAVGLVRELVARAKQSLAGAANVVLTGGDAAFFAAALPELQPAPADFTLRGILLGYLGFMEK